MAGVDGISDTLVNGVKHFEGLYLERYLCPTGHWTIGYGHLCPADQLPITEAEANDLLMADLKQAASDALRLAAVLKYEPQYRLDAIASWIFNLGAGNFSASTLRKRINEEDWAAAANEIKRWKYGTVKGKKVELPGLVRRRDWEAKVFWNGDYDI